MEKRDVSSASLEQEQETLWYLGGLRIIAALGEQPNRSSKLYEYREPSGTFISSYSPQPEETAFYLAEGEATFFSEGKALSATPGTFLFLPRNLSFRHQVAKFGSARIITWTTNRGFAQQVINMGQPDQAFMLAPPTHFAQEKMHQLTTLLLNML